MFDSSFALPIRVLKRMLIAATLVAHPAAMAGSEGVPATMDFIVFELAVLLTARDTPNKTSTDSLSRQEQALDALVEQSTLLGAHLGRDDQALMAANLAHKFEALRWHFRRGAKVAYRRGLDDVLDACGACHRRSASAGSSTFASDVLPPATLAGIQPVDRVRVLIASRQFGRARHVLDAAIANADSWESLAPLLRIRIDIGLRILPDRVALEALLRSVAGTLEPDSLGLFHVERWLTSLQDLSLFTLNSGNLVSVDSVEALLNIAGDQHTDRAYPMMLAASQMSYALLAESSLPAAARGRAYYLAALAEEGLPAVQYLPLQELFLELSIRAAPAAPSAQKALKRLEESLRTQFDGEETMPAQISEHLATLRALVSNADK